MKRLLALLLLAVMLFSLAACADDEEDDETTTTEHTSESGDGGEEAPVEGATLTLVEDGVFLYDIVYKNDAMDATKRLVKALEKLGLKNKAGALYKEADYLDFCVRDTRLSDADYNAPGAKYILIGNTKFADSATVATGIRAKDYVIRQINDKIAIVGGTDNQLMNAIIKFAVALEQSGSTAKEISFFGSYKFNEITIGGKPLKEFTIVYAEGEVSYMACGSSDVLTRTYDYYAELLQQALLRSYGYLLPLKATSSAEKEGEILVGPTTRALSETTAATKTKNMHYMLKTQGTKLALCCPGNASYYFLGSSLDRYFEDNKDAGNNVAIASGVTHTELSGTIDAEDLPKTAGTVRFMTFNIRSQLNSWMGTDALGNQLTVDTTEARREKLMGTIYLTDPDVIGFQEVTGTSHSNKVTVSSAKNSGSWAYDLPKFMSDEFGTTYEFLFHDGLTASSGSPVYNGVSGRLSTNTIAWIKEKYKKKAWGVWCYTNSNNNGLRNMVWVLLEDNATKEQFIFTNGHWDYATESGSRTAQIAQAAEQAEKINTLVSTYNCPVISVADFNCPQSETAYKDLVSEAKMVDARYPAQEKGKNADKTAEAGNRVDHIFYRDGMGTDCLFFKTLHENMTSEISDHDALIADIDLRK